MKVKFALKDKELETVKRALQSIWRYVAHILIVRHLRWKSSTNLMCSYGTFLTKLFKSLGCTARLCAYKHKQHETVCFETRQIEMYGSTHWTCNFGQVFGNMCIFFFFILCALVFSLISGPYESTYGVQYRGFITYILFSPQKYQWNNKRKRKGKNP